MITLHYNNQPIPPDQDGTYTSLVESLVSDIHQDLGSIDHADETQPELDCTPMGIMGTLELLRMANPDLNLQWRITA